MANKKAYSNISFSKGMLFNLQNSFILVFFLSVFFLPSSVFAQEQPEYDEVPVFLDVPRLGGFEIAALIKGNELYLPVTDLFDFLKIRNVPSQGLESISGFFLNPEAMYSINRSDNSISYQDKVFNLEPGDIIRTESNLYLRSLYFGKVFGLDCNFNFRSLSVTLNTKLELPIIREMRQEEMRRNLNHLKGEIKTDTTIGRTYPLFKFGMADWSAIATEEIDGRSETRLNLALGAMIAGGEATVHLNYNSMDPFNEKDQYYLWRHVNNDFQPLRQAMLGKIATNATSSLYNPVIGVQLTNTPTTFRRSFGTYTLSDRTEPGWIVELYVNNVLVDYQTADASGFFSFEVPLVYGNSMVQLKFYGPWGEERVREQNINIPYNFLPKNTMEYNVSAGIVEDTLRSRFSRSNISYGVTRTFTVGGGLEYLSSVKSNPAMPYINASLSLFNNLLLSGEYTYGVRTKGTLSYRFPSNVQFDLNYTKYDKDQKAINYNYLEERKAVISLPLHIRKFSSYQRFTLYQIILPVSKYTTGEWMFSGSIFGINTNLSTYAIFIGKTEPNIYSNLSLALRLPAGFIFRPQAQYGYTQKELLSMRLGMEKHLFEHAYLNMSYEQNFHNNLKYAELGLRYDFAFAQTGLSARQSNKKITFVEYARGSLINDKKTKYHGTDNRTNVGRGGICVVPFIDINSNGKRDPGEPKAYGLNLHANGGRVEKSERDSTIRILGLEPYTNCLIDLDPNSFDNISWRLPIQTLTVVVDPNVLKYIEIPVSVAGEASGTVSLEKNGEKNGIGRIIISFFNSSHKSVGKTLTEDDGYFSYFGFAPGKYTVMPDSSQLNKLGMTSDPESLGFDINAGIDGDIADGLDFTLMLKKADTTGIIPILPDKPQARKDTSFMIIHEVTQELVTITEDSYAIQLGAFQVKANAENLRRKLETLLGKNVKIVIEDNFFKVRISEIKERADVDKTLEILKANGITEVWVISLKAKKQQLILTERQDTIMQITDTRISDTELTGAAGVTVQLGAFREKSNAMELLKQLKAKYGNRLKMVFDDGFYKLRLSGMTAVKREVLDELNKLGPNLGKLKFNDIWMSPPIAPAEEEPVPVVRTEIIIERAERAIEIPDLIIPERKLKLMPNKMVKPSYQPSLTISIRVGVFLKKSEALKAQRKITSKLNLPVEIVQQMDRYIVIIRGFHTREETYPYYPELAGLGYPGVSIIEE